MCLYIDCDFNLLFFLGRKYLVGYYNVNDMYIYLKCIFYLYCVSLKEIL